MHGVVQFAAWTAIQEKHLVLQWCCTCANRFREETCTKPLLHGVASCCILWRTQSVYHTCGLLQHFPWLPADGSRVERALARFQHTASCRLCRCRRHVRLSSPLLGKTL